MVAGPAAGSLSCTALGGTGSVAPPIEPARCSVRSRHPIDGYQRGPFPGDFSAAAVFPV